MQDKKSIVNINFSEIENNNTLSISIKDGYEAGDKLGFASSEKYFWNNEDKSLYVKTTENTNIVEVLKKVYLEGEGNKDRFLDVKYTSKDGKVIEINEYSITPSIIDSVSNTFTRASTKTENIEIDANIKEIVWESGSLIHEETKGGDFLSSAVEEQLPYYLNKSEEGDIYKILKNSLIDNNKLEIWDYNITHDKIDLAEFAKEYGSSFNYSINKDHEDLELHLSNSSEQYSIILKGIDIDNNDIDQVIHNIIIDPFSGKA